MAVRPIVQAAEKCSLYFAQWGLGLPRGVFKTFGKSLLRHADGEIHMRSMPTIVAIDEQVGSGDICADEITRTLMKLIEVIGSAGRLYPSSGSSSEEVLIDAEVGDSRYLLLRMPNPS